MTRRARTVAAPILGAALVAAAGCGALRSPGSAPEAAERLRAGAAALEEGDFTAAEADLRWAAARCGAGQYGREALLMLAVVHLDPRNPSRAPSLAADYAGRYLLRAETPPELRSLGRAVYLLALEHGGQPPDAASPWLTESAGEGEEPEEPEGGWSLVAPRSECEGEASAAGDPDALPELPVASVPERIAAVEGEREALRREKAQLTARLAELQRELARIRKLIKH